jgi:hypothetical protein
MKRKERVYKKGFGDLFSDSWKEYKNNWKTFAMLIIIFTIIPLLIIIPLILPTTIEYIEIVSELNLTNSSDLTIYQDIGTPTKLSLGLTGNVVENEFESNLEIRGDSISYDELPPEFWKIFGKMMLFGFIGAIIYFLFSIFMLLSLFYIALHSKGKKVGIIESFTGGLRFIWRYIGLIFLFLSLGILYLITIIISISLMFISPFLGILLFLVFFIGGFILLFYLFIKWIFTIYFIIGENKGIIDSLSLSSRLVRGRWWNVFGTIILLGLIMYLFNMVGSIVIGIPNFILTILLSVKSISLATYLWIILPISIIMTTIIKIYTYPLSILFMKNFYINLKKHPVRKKQ